MAVEKMVENNTRGRRSVMVVYAGASAIIADVVFQHLFSFGSMTVAVPSIGDGQGEAHSTTGGTWAALRIGTPNTNTIAVLSSPRTVSALPSVILGTKARPSGAARRRDIARTRVLRGRIQVFEEAFATAHEGRKPLGIERAPLSDIYSEYRAMKQQIRGMYSADCTW